MLPWLTVAIIAATLIAIRNLPASLWRAYRASFAARHGVHLQVSLAVLGTLAFSMLVATLLLPERRPLVEQLDAVVVALGVLAGAADLYLFSRSRRVRR
jgi:hypothetical protein